MTVPELRPFGPQIWTAEGPVVAVAGFRYPTRMAVIRLTDGSLFIWSPIALTPGLKTEVEALGQVTHIVAPNTLHEETGLYKIQLAIDELLTLDTDQIQSLARNPRPFGVSATQAHPQGLMCELWEYACAVADSRTFAMPRSTNGGGWVFRDTFDFMMNGAPEGTRAQRLFRAAVNLLQIGCPRAAVVQLLGPAALMSGLSPDDAERQLDGAILHLKKPRFR